MTEWGIDTLFNPGKRHMDEEKRRLQSTREEIGDSSGGKRIDLESGVVKIGRANQAEDDQAETKADRDEADRDEADPAQPAEQATEDQPPALSKAAARARERRARQSS